LKINLFIPCFVDQLFPSVGISVVRIFEKLGHAVDFKESILCCGQPAFNAGYWEETRGIARRVLEFLAGSDPVVVPSGSCAAMVKNFYPELFRETPQADAATQLSQRVFEFSSFLVDQLGVTDLGSRFPAKVTFHDGCHGLRELHVKDQPRQLLERVKDLTLVGSYEKARAGTTAHYQDWQAARAGASVIKWEAINHLDVYLTEFADKLAARGTKVFWASDGQQARDYVVALAKEKGARSIIKSKSMTSEEIHLNEALRQAGYEVVESDLGEYIVQLREEAPYHLVFPAMHLTRHEISDLFQEKLHSQPTDSPEELTMIARRELRMKYLQADMGISGANFGVPSRSCRRITWSSPEPISSCRIFRRPLTFSRNGTLEITPVLSRSSRARVGPATSSEFWSWGPMAPRTLR
jgi:LUD domain/Cysteine-rich domain